LFREEADMAKFEKWKVKTPFLVHVYGTGGDLKGVAIPDAEYMGRAVDAHGVRSMIVAAQSRGAHTVSLHGLICDELFQHVISEALPVGDALDLINDCIEGGR
jgi:hypothetical protein